MPTWNEAGPIEPGNDEAVRQSPASAADRDLSPAVGPVPVPDGFDATTPEGYAGPVVVRDARAEPRETGDSFGAIIIEILQTVLLALVIFLMIRMVLQNFRIEGSSMEPNFHDGQFLFINRWAYCPGLHLDIAPANVHVSETRCLWEPQRGDVIVFRYPRDPSKDYIKRVIGLPGERVEVRNGEVLIDGQPMKEPFGPNQGTYTSPPTIVPEDNVYVMGDNRNNSSDSHLWGPLPNSYIVGRAWVSYWPYWDWGVVKRWPASTFGLRETVNTVLQTLIRAAASVRL